MALRLFITLILLSAGFNARTQNLVFNPSLESKQSCPDNFSQIHKADGWGSAGGTPDYFHKCGFYFSIYTLAPNPPDGLAISSIGISFPFSLRNDTIFREYMEGRLTSTLEDELYFFSMQILADPRGRTRNLGIHFSDTSLGVIGTYPKDFVPQMQFSDDWLGDYGKWKRHCGCIGGLEGANYFIVGNFNPPGTDSLEMSVIDSVFSNRIYLDLFEMRKPRQLFIRDTLLLGTCLDLPLEVDSIPYLYIYNQDTITQFCPNQIGDCTIKQCPLNCHNCFDLIVHVKENNCNIFIPNIIALGSEQNSIFMPILGNETDAKIMSFSVWDRQGGLIYQSSDSTIGWDGRTNGKLVNPGVFVYSVEYECTDNEGVHKSRISGDLTVIR